MKMGSTSIALIAVFSLVLVMPAQLAAQVPEPANVDEERRMLTRAAPSGVDERGGSGEWESTSSQQATESVDSFDESKMWKTVATTGGIHAVLGLVLIGIPALSSDNVATGPALLAPLVTGGLGALSGFPGGAALADRGSTAWDVVGWIATGSMNLVLVMMEVVAGTTTSGFNDILQ